MSRRLSGDFDEMNAPTDIVTMETRAFVRISPKYGVGQPGNALVCATAQVENLYDMHEKTTASVFNLVRRIAIAIRATYDFHGVSIRQHNEPAGDQDVWHMYVHVAPRRHGDDFYRRPNESH